MAKSTRKGHMSKTLCPIVLSADCSVLSKLLILTSNATARLFLTPMIALVFSPEGMVPIQLVFLSP